MLNKLLKYDLKYMFKSMIVFYILIIFFSITTRILFSLKQTTIIVIMGQISVGCMFSMMINALINTIMRSWVKFKESTYGDESYLTHTLPVSKKSIYESKFLLTIIYQLVGFIVIVLGLLIAYYTKERWDLLVKFISDTSGILNIPIIPCIVGLISVLYLEFFNMIQSGYLGIILGHKKSNNKIAYSVLFGFIAYMLSQFFVIILIFVVGLFNKEIMSLFTSMNGISADLTMKIILLANLIYLVINIIVNIICVKSINRGVNVE